MASQSLFAGGRSFMDIYNYAQTMKEIHYEDKEVAIRGRINRSVTIGAIVAHYSKVEVF